MAATLRSLRLSAGLSQAEVAARAGMTQSVVARLEAGRVVPTIATVERVLAVTGHQLSVTPVETATGDVDETQLRERLALTPAERLRAFSASQRRLTALAGKARRVPR